MLSAGGEVNGVTLSGGGLRSLELMYNSMELSDADLRMVGLERTFKVDCVSVM